MHRPFFEIPYYHDFLSPSFARNLLSAAIPFDGVPGLEMVGPSGGLETPEAFRFMVELYERVKPELSRVLAQRTIDRKFLDERVRAVAKLNRDLGRKISDPDYQTVLGLEDGRGRVVFGPLNEGYGRPGGASVADLPPYLRGPHVTLFGPPDSAKLSINAMNAFHRRLPNEPALVESLLARTMHSPMWGADDEDSKTPLRADLIDAGLNLTKCFEGTLKVAEGEKTYALAPDRLSLPIKRFPGLALPSSFLFYQKNPIPLHLYDFALHLFHNWSNPRALVFYVPKLENEEEAAYIHQMVKIAEGLIRDRQPDYREGTVRLMIVLENPRAILRAHEIMDALHPFFAGASLGWHDYLASTARLFREDAQYRIPVKADPNIVIKYIKASHDLLADVVGSRGGVKVGGMYGILPIAGHAESLQITLRGFIKDVVTQLKRGLTGFWVAHPDFVRLGLAIVEAWRERAEGRPETLAKLVRELLDKKYHAEILTFCEAKDVAGLDPRDPNYVRALIVADIEESDFIPNHHPDEIRYNVFQSLQYLTDWLSGNGCVALPTIIDGVPVRVMDDLATAERSRWEVWAELRHGRFPVEDFVRIVHEEMRFIRRDLSDGKKIVQVRYDERTAKWYPIALRIMLQLMTDPQPCEFATELLLPFTADEVRKASDPWAKIGELDPGKYRLPEYVERYHHYFEICGTDRFAREMAQASFEDLGRAESVTRGFSLEEVREAAGFHGDIGQNARTLDPVAASEQSRVLEDDAEIQAALRKRGEEYRAKFEFKFLISAKGKSAKEILEELEQRISRSSAEELVAARSALWEISRKRMALSGRGIREEIEDLRHKYRVAGAQFAINTPASFAGGEDFTQILAFGDAVKGESVAESTRFELASLSKTLAAAFALEYFSARGIALDTPVNPLFERTASPFRIRSSKDPAWANRVTLAHLMDHSALGMHYVRGTPTGERRPTVAEILDPATCANFGFEPLEVLNEPGRVFHYSGGGFLVLEHLIESLEKKSVSELTRPFLAKLGLRSLSFDGSGECATGNFDDGKSVPGGRFEFPAFAAGAIGTARDMGLFLRHLTRAYRDLRGAPGISHDTAVTMLRGFDRGCLAFMGCRMGLGVFIAEAGRNRIAVHQGANEGFRALYLQCFDGPDRGKGAVFLANSDNQAVGFIAESAQLILRKLGFTGIDFGKFAHDFKFQGLAQEQIVNLGYKKLLLDAFLPDLPEPILKKGPPDPLAARNLLVGARILSVSDQKFARAENLISPFLPVFDPELFGRQGKIMDSWETVRHNPDGKDGLALELKKPGKVRYLTLSTQFHDGNHPEFVRIEVRTEKGDWVEILGKTRAEGHSEFLYDVGTSPVGAQIAAETITQVRIEIFPDGGLSRVGLYSDLPFERLSELESPPRWKRFAGEIPKSQKPLSIPYRSDSTETAKNLASARTAEIDHASLAFGGSVVSASNEHYGPAAQVVSPYPPLHMFDGLESARSREPGHYEEVELKLGRPVEVASVVFDFEYFVNNNPVAVSIEGRLEGSGNPWQALSARVPVKAFAGNQKEIRVNPTGKVSAIRVRIFPDGGVNRIRVYAANLGE